MACTQVLEDSVYIPAVNNRKVKVGVLFINGLRHDIFSGENVIGRDEESDIVISSGAISTKHAVIEVEDSDTHLIYDAGSTNKTRLGKVVLKPLVRYNLQNGDEIMFANIKATYTRWTETICDSDTGSETGSESNVNFDDESVSSALMSKNEGNSKTDIDTFNGSLIDETTADGLEASATVNKSIKSPYVKNGNDSVLCSSGSYLDTPLFQRVKSVNKAHSTDKQGNSSVLSIGQLNNSTAMSSKILHSISEVPESDDEDDDNDDDDFCILSQKLRSSEKAKKKKMLSAVDPAPQNQNDKSFDDSTDFFDETNILRTGNKSVSGLPALQSPTSPANNTKHEESLENMSQCESQSLLTECTNVCDVPSPSEKPVVIADKKETEVPLNETTSSVDIKDKDKTHAANEDNESDGSSTIVDSDLLNDMESHSLLAEGAKSVSNETRESLLSHRDKNLNKLKSSNVRNIPSSVSTESSHDKADESHKDNVSIYDAETQLPEELDDHELQTLYEVETRALLNQHKSRFGNKKSPLKNNLLKDIGNISYQESSIHESTTESGNIQGDTIFDVDTQLTEGLKATHVSEAQKCTVNKDKMSKDMSIFDADTQIPEQVDPTRISEILKNVLFKDQGTKEDGSIYDADTQIPEQVDPTHISEILKNVLFKDQGTKEDGSIYDADTQVPEEKLSEGKIHDYKTHGSDKVISDHLSHVPSVSSVDDISDAETQKVVYTSKGKLTDEPSGVRCGNMRKLKSEESNEDSRKELETTLPGEKTDPFKMPSSLTKSVMLSNKKRGVKKVSGTQNIGEDSLTGEDSQERGCRISLFKDIRESPYSSPNPERMESKLSHEEEKDISGDLTQKLIVPSSKTNIGVSAKTDDMKSTQNCDEQDISEELTQKLSVTKRQSPDVRDKLLRAQKNEGNYGTDKYVEEDMSDELTQNISTPKLRNLCNTSNTLVENDSCEHKVVIKMATAETYEDISDELTQKIPTPKHTKLSNTSTPIASDRYNKNDKGNVNKSHNFDELTQKFITPKSKNTASTSNKVLRVSSEKKMEKIEECNEDMSDELTQKFITPKSKNTASICNKVLRMSSGKKMEKIEECNEDMSDELTQKFITPKSKNTASISNKVLRMSSGKKMEKIEECNEDMSDELTQKFITPKSKNTASISNKVLRTPSEKKMEKIEECNEDISDELTQKFVTPKGKLNLSFSKKVLDSTKIQEERGKSSVEDLSDKLTEKLITPKSKHVLSGSSRLQTENKNQTEPANISKGCDADLSDEATQKFVLPGSRKTPTFTDRKLETPHRKIDNAINLNEEDMSDDLTQKMSTPRNKSVPHVFKKLVEMLNQADKSENCNEEDMSDELTQKIVMPKDRQTPRVNNKAEELVSTTELYEENKEKKSEQEMSDVRNKIRRVEDKQMPTNSANKQTKTYDKKNQRSPRRGLQKKHNKDDLSDETIQNFSEQNLKQNSVNTVKEDKVTGIKSSSSKRRRQFTESKSDLIDAKSSEMLHIGDIEQQKTVSNEKGTDIIYLTDETTQKFHGFESGRNKETDKAKFTESSHQKRQTRKQVKDAEKHEAKRSDVSHAKTEAVIPQIQDAKDSRKLVVSLDREEVNTKIRKGEEKSREKHKTDNSSKLKNKRDLTEADSNISSSNKKQDKVTGVRTPLNGNNTSTDVNKSIITSCIFDDSDDTDIEDIFVEDDVKKFKERKICDYFKKEDKKLNSDEESRITRRSKTPPETLNASLRQSNQTSFESKLQKRNNVTPRKQSDRRSHSHSPSPFALPSLASVRKAEEDYYEKLSPLKIPGHIRDIEKDISEVSSTNERSCRRRQNVKKRIRYNTSTEQLEKLDEKSNKKVKKTKSDKTQKSNNTSSSRKSPAIENCSVTIVLSKKNKMDIQTKGEPTSKNNNPASSGKSNSTREEREKRLNDTVTVKNDKNKTISEVSCENNTSRTASPSTDKSPFSHKVVTRRYAREHIQKENKNDRKKRSHSPIVNTERKPKEAKLLSTEEENEVCNPFTSDTENSRGGKVGMRIRVTRQVAKGKDTKQSKSESKQEDQIEIMKNKDSNKSENRNDTRRRKRILELTLSKDVSDPKIRKLVNLSDTESSEGVKIIRKTRKESNPRLSENKSDLNKTREANMSVVYDDITDSRSMTSVSVDSFSGLDLSSGNTECSSIRKSKRLLQNKLSDRTVKSVITNDRRSSRLLGKKTHLNNVEENQNNVETPATAWMQSSKKGSQANFTNNECERVLFTGMSDPKLEAIIKKLGGVIANSPQDCTVLVTDKVRRTVKLLCAVGQGKPVVTPNWVMKSQAARHFLDPWQHLVADTETEKKYNFQLHKVLTECKHRHMLEKYSVYITPSVRQPSIPEVKAIIESCEGKVLEKVPSKWPDKSFIISCTQDKSAWKKLERKSVLPPVVETETLLSGVFHNHINLNYHRLH